MLTTPIPFVDLRGKSPVDLLRSYPDKARDLIRGARGSFGKAGALVSAPVLAVTDWRSKALLARTSSPYRHEIESFADILETPGVYAVNMCYEWGCTSGVWRNDEHVTLLRVLDWPFNGLGKHVLVAWQSSRAGDFYNVTWPGLSGMYQGMAPGRFCAAINQAPMRGHGRGFIGDWIINRWNMREQTALPPSHVLRMAFEQAKTYDDAKKMLAETPLAVPAIFMLSGVEMGQGCIIERQEAEAQIIELGAGTQATAANHFNSHFAARKNGWHPRALDSAGRYRQSTTISSFDLAQPDFGWLGTPIVNAETRLALVADAATGRMLVQGFEGALPATALFNMQGHGARESALG